MSLRHKTNRYKTLLKDFKNWPQFLFFKLFGGQSFNFKMRNGFEIKVTKQMLSPFRESFFDGVYLKNFSKTQLEKPNPVVVDIGGNVGFFSLFIFSKYPEASVFTYEPMPFNFNQLAKYRQENSEFNWTIEKLAVADNKKGLTLYSSTVDSFSTMATVFKDKGRNMKINVPTLTLNDLIEINQLKSIDILKLDCEGAEYSIIYATTEHNLSIIKKISIETHIGDSDKKNHHALVEYLRSKGFSLEHKLSKEEGYIWAWR